jgi:hypothetical protein
LTEFFRLGFLDKVKKSSGLSNLILVLGLDGFKDSDFSQSEQCFERILTLEEASGEPKFMVVN